MDGFQLKINPVYSPYISIEESADLGSSNVRLLRHQADTLRAYQDSDVNIIFNTAMTGDGKTMAAYLPAMLHGKRAVAAYPTNELIHDQEQSVMKMQQRFNRAAPLKMMYGEAITEYMAEAEQSSRPEQVKRLLDENDIVLTNPDLFHLIMSYNYGWNQRRELVANMLSNFHYYIFDEFHIFAPPQVIDVANIINTVAVERHRAEQRRKFIFLSATPNPLLHEMLSRSDLKLQDIKGEYYNKETPNTRRILAPCTLDLCPTTGYRTEQWVLDHVAEILAFYRAYPASKGAIIVNSVAAAHRLLKELREPFREAGLTVLPNTGLTKRDTRRASYKADLLIGTSTVDVGVDFQINLLIFEANSSADFLQRFGRLGRHSGYITADGLEVQFDPASYRAYALCPAFIVDRIAIAVGLRSEDGQPGPLDQATPLDRPDFSRDIIGGPTVFPDRQQFKAYTRRWGLLQAAPFIINLESPGKFQPDNYAEQREATAEQLARSFAVRQERLDSAVKYYRKLRHGGEDDQTMLDEINSFRGTSLSCGVWDADDDELKTYNLLYILANSEFAVMSEADFMAEVARRHLLPYNYRYQIMYLKVLKYLPKRDEFGFRLPNHDILRTHRDRLNHASVLKGFRIVDLPRSNIGDVNDIFTKQRLVCTITNEFSDPKTLKSRLNLAFNFPVHRLTDNTHASFCVAFGKPALLLDSLLWWRKNKADDSAYFDHVPQT